MLSFDESDIIWFDDVEVSLALPDDLRSFTSEERAATDEICSTPTTLSGRVEDFRTKCQWGQLASPPSNEIIDATLIYFISPSPISNNIYIYITLYQ